MDVLNNLNVVISIIVGLFGIGGYIVGMVAYFRHKVTSSQQTQTIQLQSSLKQSSYQPMSNSLSKWDWMQVLWLGFEDCFRAREGGGWMFAAAVGVVGGIITFTISPFIGVIFLIFFFSFLLLFYVYFVGRIIEKKVEEKSNSVQSH
jgi:hypothetical protein